MAANTYGKGRAVYLTSLSFTAENTRLLQRIMYWVARKESELKKWFSTNPNVECSVFPDAGKVILLNNSYEEQKTIVYDDKGKSAGVLMAPFASEWRDIGGLFE